MSPLYRVVRSIPNDYRHVNLRLGPLGCNGRITIANLLIFGVGFHTFSFSIHIIEKNQKKNYALPPPGSLAGSFTTGQRTYQLE